MDNFSQNPQPSYFSQPTPPAPNYTEPYAYEPKKSFLWIIIFAILSLWFIIISVFLIIKLLKPEQKEEIAYSDSSDVLTLRENMFEKLSNAYGYGYRNTDLLSFVNEWIVYPSTDEGKDSLAVFANYLLLRFNMLDTFEEFLKKFDESPEVKSTYECELLAYEILAKSSKNDSMTELKKSYDSLCSESYPAQSKDESNFAYAKRLFFAGNYFESIDIFESLDLKSEPEDNRLFTYSILSDHYRLVHDDENHKKIIDSFAEEVKKE